MDGRMKPSIRKLNGYWVLTLPAPFGIGEGIYTISSVSFWKVFKEFTEGFYDINRDAIWNYKTGWKVL